MYVPTLFVRERYGKSKSYYRYLFIGNDIKNFRYTNINKIS